MSNNSLIKSLTLNSKTNSISNKLDFNLSTPVYISDGYAISQFIAINSIYNISDRNNQFSFIESDTLGVVRTFTLPVGNYILSTFMSALSTALNANGSNAYTVSNDSLTNRITITAGTKTFKIIDTKNDVYYEAGFRISTAFALSQSGSSSFDLSGLKTINIVCSNLGHTSITPGSNLNVIATIPITVPYQGIVTYSPPIAFVSSQISEINSVNLVFLDGRYREINLDKDFSLTILLLQ